ncbi:MAG: sortase domain-containing protein [Pseudonocardiaceae bacterium]
MGTSPLNLFAPTLAGLALAVTGCAAGTETSPPPRIAVPPGPGVAAPVALVEPSRLIITSIGVNAPLEPLGLAPDGTLAVPDLNHVDQTGWYCDKHTESGDTPHCASGIVPGQTGAAVIAAHVDGKGKQGAFFRLKDLHTGDDIQVRRVDGSTLTFRVTRTETPKKTAFPSKAVYGNVDHPALRLLTCGGPFIGGRIGYQDQVIVYADEVT